MIKTTISLTTDMLRTFTEQEEKEANNTRSNLIIDAANKIGIDTENLNVKEVFGMLEINEVVSEGMIVITIKTKTKK